MHFFLFSLRVIQVDAAHSCDPTFLQLFMACCNVKRLYLLSTSPIILHFMWRHRKCTPPLLHSSGQRNTWNHFHIAKQKLLSTKACSTATEQSNSRPSWRKVEEDTMHIGSPKFDHKARSGLMETEPLMAISAASLSKQNVPYSAFPLWPNTTLCHIVL